MNLIGKTRAQIAEAVRNKSREEMIDILYSHTTLEPKFTVTEVAAVNRVSRDYVLGKIKSGAIPRQYVHMTTANGFRIALSGIRVWDANTALALERNGA